MHNTPKMILAAVVTLITLSLVTPNALYAAGQASKAGDSKQAKSTHANDEKAHRIKLRQVSGKVLKTQTVNVRGANQENFVALLQTTKSNDRLIVDLGPVTAVKHLAINEGTTLAVEGPFVKVRDRFVLVARRIKAGDTVVEVSRQQQAQQAKEKQAKKQ